MNDASGLDWSPTRQLGCCWSWRFHVVCNSLPLLPVVLAFAPTLAHFLPGNEAVHRSLAYLLTGIGILAFRAGYRVHRKKLELVLLVVGIAAVTVGAYASSLLPSHSWEVAITFTGSAFLIVAHWLNRTLCQSCKTCLETGHKHESLIS